MEAVEFAEDDPDQAWKDLREHMINHKDTVKSPKPKASTPSQGPRACTADAPQ